MCKKWWKIHHFLPQQILWNSIWSVLIVKKNLHTLSHEDKTDLSYSHRNIMETKREESNVLIFTVEASNGDTFEMVKNREGAEEKEERLPRSRGWVEPSSNSGSPLMATIWPPQPWSEANMMWTALMWSWLHSEVTAKPQSLLYEGHRWTESLSLVRSVL